jgi:mono/diheme cytochrome c family protein
VAKTSRKINFTWTIGFLLLILIFSCGQRSGIHGDTDKTSVKETQRIVCGNAIIDEQNYNTARQTLGIDGDGGRGEKLFKQNCAVCHDIMHRQFIEPGLQGFYSKIPEPKTEWLKNYILNSIKVYKSGDDYAKQLRQQYPKDTMTAFEGYLQDKDINDIMIYVVGNTK